MRAGAGIGEVCGVGQSCVAKSTVFINGVAFEVGSGPLNVREAFGDEAVLIHSTGQPVLTNEWGLTLHSLQHGASYYLVKLNNIYIILFSITIFKFQTFVFLTFFFLIFIGRYRRKALEL